MSHVFFRSELEGVATFWRIFRRDGYALGFTSHDRDLYFDGLIHRTAPGMVPSAIRKTADLTADSAEVEGVLSHASIRADTLAEGRFDDATIVMGAVDWETLDREILYSGSLGAIAQQGDSFTADLTSAKAVLDRDFIPRSSPTCRAQFCGPGCTLSAPRFSVEVELSAIDAADNTVLFANIDQHLYLHGELRWLDGSHTGTRAAIVDIGITGLILGTPIPEGLELGMRARLIEGCDHRLSTCQSRFDNVVNFQGEPFLPGNDLLARYPLPQ